MSVHETDEKLRERRRRQAQSRRQRQTDVMRTKDGFAWQPVAEIGAHDNRSLARVVKDNFDEAAVACIHAGFEFDELSARLQYLQHAGIRNREDEAA
jgi:hypothetical protein